MKIVIDDKIPFIRGAAERLGQTVYLPGSAISAADVRDADVLIVRTRTHCDATLLEGSRVKFIATATIGFDHLDTAYLRRAGIAWTNCPGCNATSVAQYVESALLVLARAGKVRLPQADATPPTLAVIGVGHVGSQVALRARSLGFRVLLCDPPRLAGDASAPTDALPISAAECTATLADVTREADVICVHTPLTQSGPHATYHLCDASFFASLERKPVFLNAGRGEVVATEALLAALEAGRVSEAVVDTWENEPNVSRTLLERAFLATPHIAGYSADGKANGTRMSLEAVARHFSLPAHFDIAAPAVDAAFRYFPDAPDANVSDAASARLALYDPRRDSLALKAHPDLFERLRGDYPLRRERLG